MPRVAVVTSRLDVGGTEHHLLRVLPALKQRGIDVMLYAMERGGALEAELIGRGVRVEGPERKRFMHWPRAARALAGFLRRERPTVVHFFLPRPYIYGSIAAELARHRRRLISRRSLSDYQANYPLSGVLERLLHKRTAGLIGNSRAVLEQLRAEVGEPEKVALIYNGIELPPQIGPSERQALREKLQLPSDTLAIAVVANLIAYKGHRDLIAALARIHVRLPPWRLLVVGRDDGLGDELRRQAETLRIAHNVLWLGERADVGRLLAASDIFVLPSHQEGFSNALLEAMAAKVAVIATAVGGNVDAVVDNETGLLSPPNDPPLLAANILRLANDGALRHRLAEAAQRRVQERFALQSCLDRYERLYREMSEPTPPPVRVILADCESGATSGDGKNVIAVDRAL